MLCHNACRPGEAVRPCHSDLRDKLEILPVQGNKFNIHQEKFAIDSIPRLERQNHLLKRILIKSQHTSKLGSPTQATEFPTQAVMTVKSRHATARNKYILYSNLEIMQTNQGPALCYSNNLQLFHQRFRKNVGDGDLILLSFSPIHFVNAFGPCPFQDSESS